MDRQADSLPCIIAGNDVRLHPRRDPFSWILTAMGATLLIGIPLMVITPFVAGLDAVRAVVAVFIVAMGLLVLASFVVALWKMRARHSLAGLLWFTLLTALVCAFLTTQDELSRAGVLVPMIAVITFWWTRRDKSEPRLAYVLRLAGNGVVIAVAFMMVLGGLLNALAMALNGQGR